MSKIKKESLPETIYICKEEEGNSFYFVASPDLIELSNLDEDRVVGIYKLTEEKILVTKVELK